ncbi:unnamed protein product [Durusdinium trenchii]|uniref:Uncharacterized protein n=1 Tax=Durusdinium trenchii TaxID=1381693 RepID=A0ABP0IV89_9DINO
MDPETDDTYVSKTLESLRRRLFAQRLRLEEGLLQVRSEEQRAQEQLTAADGPFPLAEEEVYEGDRFTYGETLDIAVALSRTLAQTYGVQRGLGLAQARRLTEEWVFTLIAVNGFLSAVSLPVNAWWTGIPAVCMRAGARIPPQNAQRFEELVILGKSLNPLPRRPVDQDDRAMLMYTSGTTAMPRLGEKLVMMYKWDAGRALKLIEDEKVQAIVGVPTNTYDLVNHPDFKKYDTSSMVGVGGGGAAFAAPMIKRVKDTFQNARASTGYGLTETNAVSVVMPAELFPARPTSCGLPAVNVNVCILDENNHKLPPGGVGEICFRGATIMKEYWRKPDKTSEVFHIDEHGQLWFRSGDIGALDEQNFVYILDRAKDIIIRGGENISCAEVEQAIFEHPTVAEVAAIGLPHENLGETVAVAVVFKTGSSAPDAEELREHAASLLPRHMVRHLGWMRSFLPWTACPSSHGDGKGTL